ncbi:Retrotransposon gag protein [Rhizoctonia solani]|uniref:Retrotransposon gag protein n=1 Tax=Rhizoctonia solani TaxID=456999 RepID=A0A8H7M3C4_9AGAM|nr:Retrotransposon gag protein [Rhizoctonia solani]
MAHKDAGMDPAQFTHVPTDQEVLSFLLMNMKDSAGAWAHPHLNQLGSHQAIIQTVEGRRAEDYNPHSVWHLRGLHHKVQDLSHGTGLEQRGPSRPFAHGLHWEVSCQIATRKHRPRTLLELQNAALVIDNALQEEQASHPPRDNKPSKHTNPARGQVLERNCRRAAGACIKCGKMAISLQSAAQAGRPPLLKTKGRQRNPPKLAKTLSTNWEKSKGACCAARKDPKDSGLVLEFCNISNAHRNRPLFTIPIKPEKQADTQEVLIDSGATSSFLHPCTAELLCLPLIDLPHPRTISMLDGSSPQAGKIWKKAHLTFLVDGKHMTETFLIYNTGSHAAILGIKWLETHNPKINWNLQTLSFPHMPPEQVAIAKEEEANKNPLEGVPPEYHQYAKVFGEEEFNKLPPHRHYDIGIELTEEGPLNCPLYSMTDAKSATLKDWLRDKLKAGKIRPSKLSISSPVMFVPKKDGSHCLVVDYHCLNNCTKKNVSLLPQPDDLMAQLRGAKVFTKLDLQWGYNNVRVKEGDKWKTAFQTKYGLYKSLVMTFGLTNAPATFQHFMNKLFKDLS